MKSNEERVKSILKKASEYKMKKRREGYALITCICAVAIAVLVGVDATKIHHVEDVELSVLKVNQKEVEFENQKELKLTTFKTKDELVKKLENSRERINRKTIFNSLGDLRYADSISIDSATQELSATENVAGDSGGQKSSDEYSETNTQVQGVDEADIVKTNGDYIYYLSNNTLKIINNKSEKLELEKEIDFKLKNDNDIYQRPRELYLSDDYIIVIATSSMSRPIIVENDMVTTYGFYRGFYDTTSTKVMIYDINNYDLVREIETEGSYCSSRKVDDDIYVISNKYVYFYNDINPEDVVPLFKDTCVENGETKEVDITSIKCFPDIEDDDECSYMMITSFSLDNISEKANVETFIGTGEEIYCSKENLYVTKSSYPGWLRYDNTNGKTKIRKFAIYNGKIKYVAEGEVKGTLLNQFSMDEYDGNFRITTTKESSWNSDTSENNLYVLNKDLKVIGKLEGLAKGERIYSTRFMGDKCYVVTYKTVDPLFVIDLSEPTNPEVLGELKIPGYSSYLHPFGENYLIGFGEDSIEKIVKNYDGTERVTAYSTGLKLAIFDVSDYNNPKELDSVKIGGRGSYSELLYNHKSLLFKQDEGLFAFPVRLYDENAGTYENGVPLYGDLDFCGAVIFNIDTEKGITLLGKVSNENTENPYSNIERIIYIGDKLYTISSNMIKVLDMDTMKEVSKIEF